MFLAIGYNLFIQSIKCKIHTFYIKRDRWSYTAQSGVLLFGRTDYCMIIPMAGAAHDNYFELIIIFFFHSIKSRS